MRWKSSRTVGYSVGGQRRASESIRSGTYLEEQSLSLGFDGLTMHETDDALELLRILERLVGLQVDHESVEHWLLGEALLQEPVSSHIRKGGDEDERLRTSRIRKHARRKRRRCDRSRPPHRRRPCQARRPRPHPAPLLVRGRQVPLLAPSSSTELTLLALARSRLLLADVHVGF